MHVTVVYVFLSYVFLSKQFVTEVHSPLCVWDILNGQSKSYYVTRTVSRFSTIVEGKLNYALYSKCVFVFTHTLGSKMSC
jgi:hypothetical protein